MTEKIKVLIVDDHSIVRDGLRLILELSEHIEVCGEAKNLQETYGMINKTHPDVVLLDFKLPDGDGVNGCIGIKNRYPKIKILILTAYSQDHLVLESIRAGADGYLLKNIKSEELIKSIIKVHEGASVLDPSVTEVVINEVLTPEKAEGGTPLSAKENHILHMVSLGKSNKEIAEVLGISEKTVRNYISNIFKKLNVSNRTEAAAYWIRKQSIE